MYINKDAVKNAYGYTPGCPECQATKDEAIAVGHNQVCRTRLEKATGETEQGRRKIDHASNKKRARGDQEDQLNN